MTTVLKCFLYVRAKSLISPVSIVILDHLSTPPHIFLVNIYFLPNKLYGSYEARFFYLESTAVKWNYQILCQKLGMILVKFIYSEKATKFCEISTLLLCYVVIVVPVKSKVEISQTFVAFSEYRYELYWDRQNWNLK